MVLVTKASGSIIRPVEKANSSTLMAMSMMEIGITIKLTGMESTQTSVEPATKVIGKMISSTAMVLRTGQKAQDTKVNTTCPRKKETGNIPTQMAQLMKANGLTTRLMALVATSGQTDASTMVNGRRTICMGLASTFTQIM